MLSGSKGDNGRIEKRHLTLIKKGLPFSEADASSSMFAGRLDANRVWLSYDNWK